MKGYSLEWVKSAMFEAMKDVPKEHSLEIYADAEKMPMELLEALDELYGVTMTIQSLSPALCGLQQWPYKSCRDYYDRMVRFTVPL